MSREAASDSILVGIHGSAFAGTTPVRATAGDEWENWEWGKGERGVEDQGRGSWNDRERKVSLGKRLRVEKRKKKHEECDCKDWTTQHI